MALIEGATGNATSAPRSASKSRRRPWPAAKGAGEHPPSLIAWSPDQPLEAAAGPQPRLALAGRPVLSISTGEATIQLTGGGIVSARETALVGSWVYVRNGGYRGTGAKSDSGEDWGLGVSRTQRKKLTAKITVALGSGLATR